MFNSDLMSTREAADALRVNTRQIARMVERGELTPAVKAPGPRGAFLFTRTDVDDLAKDRAA